MPCVVIQIRLPPWKSHILFPDVHLHYFEQRLFAPDLCFESLHRLDPHKLIDLHIQVRFNRFSFSLVPAARVECRRGRLTDFNDDATLAPGGGAPINNPDSV